MMNDGIVLITFWNLHNLLYLCLEVSILIVQCCILFMTCMIQWLRKWKKLSLRTRRRILLPINRIFLIQFKKFLARWIKSNSTLHCMAHSLVPKYYHESRLQGENGIRRLTPNDYREISLIGSNTSKDTSKVQMKWCKFL